MKLLTENNNNITNKNINVEYKTEIKSLINVTEIQQLVDKTSC